MNTPLHVVVGTDGSPSARNAVRVAAAEAAVRGLPLRILTATDSPAIRDRAGRDEEPPERRMLGDADALLAHAIDLAAETLPSDQISTDIVVEAAAPELLYESRYAALLVVGTRGHGGLHTAVLGSVSAHVAAHAHCPVLVVPEWLVPMAPDAPVVVGVDGTGRSAAALDAAFAEARLHRTSVLAVHAFAMLPVLAGPMAGAPLAYASTLRPADEAAALSHAIAPFRSAFADVPVLERTSECSASHELVEAGRGSRMIVLATRGRTGVAGLLHGSVTAAVFHHAECPVLVVRQP